MEMLLRGEHHYKMILGIPDDAKIISFKAWKEGLPAFDVLMQSDQFQEYNNMDECKEYGSLRLEGMSCMPVQGEVISKQ